jgi:PilZ domain-containing protein
MRILRSKRVSTPAIAARVCTEAARLINISATGALVQSDAPLPQGLECPFVLWARDEFVRLKVRIVWAKPLPIESPDPSADEKHYVVAVRFTELPPLAKQVVTALRGTAAEWKE